MSLLRLASKTTKKISLDDTSHIEVLTDISKRTFNELVSSMPTDLGENKSLTIPQAIQFQRELFKTFVVGWSLDAPCDEGTYEALTREAADAIDSAVAKHFESLTPTDKESSKSEGPSAPVG